MNYNDSKLYTIRKAESWKIDALERWYWRCLLRVPWTARRSNQSILEELSPEYSLEGLMLKLKLQYFGHLMQRTDIGKDPDAGKDWRQEEKGMTEDEMVGWHHWLAWVWASSRNWWWTGRPDVLQFMGSQRVRHDWTTELNWKLYTCNCISVFLAMLDLYCCIGFSLIAVRWKLLSSCSVWACHCGDLLLQSTGSTPVVCGLRCSVACGNLPGLGIKPMSPALAGRFFTTEPPGGPKTVHLDAAHLLSQYESSVIL